MDVGILEKIGLTKGEIKAYLALLKLGSSSTGPLATKSGVSRSKLYTILDKLEKKGLASHVDRQGVRYFQAVEPSKIKDYIKERKEEMRKLEEEFQDFLPKIQAQIEKGGQGHKINVYIGFKGLRTAHDHKYLKLKRGEGYSVLGVPRYKPGDDLNYWQTDHKRRDEAGIRSRILFNRNADRKVLKNRNGYKYCEARYMPSDMRTPAYFMTYKDTTLITIPGGDVIAIEIVSQDVTDAFQAYFDEFWKRSKPFR